MTRRICVSWTYHAREALKQLPKKVQRNILNKTKALSDVDDPRRIHKPLTGPLQNYYSIKAGRYRVLYQVIDEQLSNGDVYTTIHVIVVCVVKREEGSRNDVYNLAQRLVRFASDALDEHEANSDKDDLE